MFAKAVICPIFQVEATCRSRISSTTGLWLLIYWFVVGFCLFVCFFLLIPFIELDPSFTCILSWHKLALALEETLLHR